MFDSVENVEQRLAELKRVDPALAAARTAANRDKRMPSSTRDALKRLAAALRKAASNQQIVPRDVPERRTEQIAPRNARAASAAPETQTSPVVTRRTAP